MQLVNEGKLSVDDSAGKFLPGFKNGRVTIRQLLSHESGLPNYTDNQKVLENIKLVNYTNSDYVVLADIIEKVMGKTYAQALAERIFIPLGMRSSFFASGDTTNVVGAGGIISSGGDLLRWVNALSANTLLPKEMMDELLKPRVAWDEWNAWYAYGWMIDRHLFDVSKRHLVQYQIGSEFGFHNILLREPDKNVVVILLSNMGDFPRLDMADLILKELN